LAAKKIVDPEQEVESLSVLAQSRLDEETFEVPQPASLLPQCLAYSHSLPQRMLLLRVFPISPQAWSRTL
jgi:hypothetical protein